MTSLTILPNTDKKTLKLTGKVAAGEHVAVSVSGGADWIGVGKALRLRVLFGMKQVAMFPLVTEEDAAADTSGETVADAWAAGGEGAADATCTLNLFTIPAEKYLKFGGNCLWVLDDIENNTLYGTGEMEVLPWPKRRGSDVPYALDEYPDIVAELGERIDAAEVSISGAVDEANGIVAYVTAAKSDAESSAQTARVARNQAQTAQGKAEDAQAAAEAAQAAAEAALPLDTTLATEGKAADAKAVGDAIALKADKSTTYTKSEIYTKIETTNAISSAIATVVDSAPEAFDTLKEIADWIEDDQSGAAAMAAEIKGKVDKVSGKGLSANDYTDAEKSKLAGIAAGAQVNPTPIAPVNATKSGMFADAYWTQQDLAGKADASSLAPVATSGNYDDLRGKPGNVSAFANDAGYLTSHQQLRYAMPESVALTPSGDAATLVCADRAVTNATIVTGFSTLNLSFPAAVSGYVRDFYLRITVAAGESAPSISVPQGITIENAGGAVPVIADGEASAAATTLVWFSETAPGVFTAKSETVKAVV